MSDDFLCDTEDGACRFSAEMRNMQSEVERLRAENKRMHRELDESRQCEAVAEARKLQSPRTVDQALELARDYFEDRMGGLYGPAHAIIETLALEVPKLRGENAKLQEIALRVKLGQLEVWPDASQTEVGRALVEARRENAALHVSKDTAYRERNQLVCALSKVFQAHLMRHPDRETWDDDWRWIVCFDLPAGQATWHIHDSERSMFDHLVEWPYHWDGHSTKETYARLAELKPDNGLAKTLRENERLLDEVNEQIETMEAWTETDKEKDEQIARLSAENKRLREAVLGKTLESMSTREAVREEFYSQLRLKNDDLIEQVRSMHVDIERLRAKVAEDALTIGALRDELSLERTKLAACAVVAQGGSYEGTHPAAVSHALDEVHALRKRLERFQAREPSVRALRNDFFDTVEQESGLAAAYDKTAAFDCYECENPKSEGGR